MQQPIRTLKPEQPCRACGAPVPRDAPFGHCPNCLVQLGFGPLPDDWQSSPSRRGGLGEYELLEQIGRGGMGIVYKARQVSLKRLVALKMLSTHAAAFPGIVERIRIEAEAAGGLSHPHIVTVYDTGEHDGQPFFTMELIEGSSLDKLIGPGGFRGTTTRDQPQGKRDDAEAGTARIMIQIAHAVDYAHRHGVLHRDLKPGNIVIDAQGEPHLTDFGLAKVLGPAAASGTASGAILGTPSYMAPEQASGATKNASIAADVYSLGAILYEMLTGHPPFRADTPLETLRQVVEQSPKPPSTFNHKVDRDLATICLKCLEKDPAHRYSTARAMAEDLDRWSRGEPIAARPIHDLKRLWFWCRREPVLASLLIGLFALLLAVAALGWSLYQRGQTDLQKEQREKSKIAKEQLDRIEIELQQNGEARITAKQLALLAGPNLVIDGTERLVVIGVSTRLRKPDEAVYQLLPLISYLQTNLAAMTKPVPLFDLQIYTSRQKSLEGLSRGGLDLMRADPAEYVLARQQDTNIFPLVKQSYSGRTEIRAAIFTATNSGVRSLADLKGKSFAFEAQGFALGDYLPKAALVNAGLLAGDFQLLTNARSASVIRAVRDGRLAAGVAEMDDLENARRLGLNVNILQELRCPTHPWLATRKLDRDLVEAIKNRLLAQTDAVLPFDNKLTGFKPALPTDYDALARDIETAQRFDDPR